MGKASKRKRKVSAPSTAKGPVKSAMAMVKSNPFEVKVNRQKFNILGRKTKNDVGLPGVSRSKAIKKVRGHQKLEKGVASVDIAVLERWQAWSHLRSYERLPLFCTLSRW